MSGDLIERFHPFIGTWRSEAAGPGIGSRLACKREFIATPGGGFVIMVASWPTTSPMYEEVASFSLDEEGLVLFVSSTSDRQRSVGRQASAIGLGADALVFEARLPAGVARMIYRSEGEASFHLAVENEAPGGWNRFMEHRYRRIAPDA